MGTTTYQALDRLVEILALALASEDVAVIDGGLTHDSPPNALCVGYSAGEGLSADGEQRRQEGLSLTRRSEDYDIPCTIYVTDGDSDAGEARAKNRAIYEAVEAAVAADPQLAGSGDPLVNLAVMGYRFVLNQEQTQGGAECICRFTIHCEALIP